MIQIITHWNIKTEKFYIAQIYSNEGVDGQFV